MDRSVAIAQLYADAVELISKYVGKPSPIAFINPSGWARDWASKHPNEARNLAAELHNLLDGYFRGGGA